MKPLLFLLLSRQSSNLVPVVIKKAAESISSQTPQVTTPPAQPKDNEKPKNTAEKRASSVQSNQEQINSYFASLRAKPRY